ATHRNQTRIQTPGSASQRVKDHQLNKSVPVIQVRKILGRTSFRIQAKLLNQGNKRNNLQSWNKL
ncbi:MAG: hypothetical protein ACI8XC_003100, partial [Gammaproteobacteria bacterium]